MTTTNLQAPTRRTRYDLPVPAAIAICVFSLILIALIVGRVRTAQQVAAMPTPALAISAPIIIIATSAPLPAVAPADVVVSADLPSNVVRRAIVVYGAPDLATAIGAVEAGRTFVPVSRWGSEWIEVDMDGSGRVFVRTTDLYGVPELADLQPTEAPQVVYVSAPQPAYYAAPTPAEQSYQAASEPAAPELAPQQQVLLDRGAWAAAAATARAGK